MEPATAYAICEQLAAALQSGALSPDAATAAEVAIQAVQTAFGVDLANPAHRNAWSLRRRNTSLANLVNLALSVAVWNLAAGACRGAWRARQRGADRAGVVRLACACLAHRDRLAFRPRLSPPPPRHWRPLLRPLHPKRGRRSRPRRTLR